MKKVLYSLLILTAFTFITDRSLGDNLGVITVIKPEAGIKWLRGNPYNITWYYDHAYNVEIQLTGPAPSLTTTTITPVGGVPSIIGTNTWPWPILLGQDTGSYTITITSTANPATYVVSSPFTIIGTDPAKIITIYRPSFGEKWVKGSTQPVTWWDNLGVTPVIPKLYTAAGVYKLNLAGVDPATTTANNNGGTLNWLIPSDGSVPEGSYYIQLFSSTDPNINVKSGNFTIVSTDPNKYITVYAPSEGEKLLRGQSRSIVWTDNISENVNIQLYATDKTTRVMDIHMNIASLGTSSWDFNVSAGDYYIKISSTADSTNVYGWSGLLHVITTNPNSVITVNRPSYGEHWVKGLEYPISWWTNITDPVKIELYTEANYLSATPLGTITASTGCIVGNNTLNWTISDFDITHQIAVDANYYIKITSTLNSSINVWSGIFRVIATDPNKIITIYTPAVGEKWVNGSTHIIHWYDNLTEGVNIKLYKSDNTFVGSIGSGNTGSDQSWTISDFDPTHQITPDAYYYIKISSTTDAANVYVNSGIFEIIGTDPNKVITVYNPSAGEAWVEGSQHNITWTDNITGNVKIELYTDEDVCVGPITLSTENDGTYAWTLPWHEGLVPGTVPGGYKIKISESAIGNTEMIQKGGDRLVNKQYVGPEIITTPPPAPFDGAYPGEWGWPLDATPTYANTLAPIAKGLVQSYHRTLSATQLAAVNLAKTALLHKMYNFSPPDGILAKAIDDILGGTTCVTYVKTNFYDKLASGSYDRNQAGPPYYSTTSYINLIHTARAGNMSAWDVGLGLAGAACCGADLTDWITGTQAELSGITMGNADDVLGLSGALYGLAFVHAAFDLAKATTLASHQRISGVFENYNGVTHSYYESNQVTSYAILALNEVNRTTYVNKIQDAADYLASVQLPTGGWEDFVGDGENNEVTGEVLWAYTVAYQPFGFWSSPFTIIPDGKKSAMGLNNDHSSAAVTIYPNPASDKINVTSDQNINRVWLLNNMGATVLETKANSNSLILNLSGLNPGIYFVKIETDGNVATTKVVIR